MHCPNPASVHTHSRRRPTKTRSPVSSLLVFRSIAPRTATTISSSHSLLSSALSPSSHALTLSTCNLCMYAATLKSFPRKQNHLPRQDPAQERIGECEAPSADSYAARSALAAPCPPSNAVGPPASFSSRSIPQTRRSRGRCAKCLLAGRARSVGGSLRGSTSPRANDRNSDFGYWAGGVAVDALRNCSTCAAVTAPVHDVTPSTNPANLANMVSKLGTCLKRVGLSEIASTAGNESDVCTCAIGTSSATPKRNLPGM